MSKIFIKLMSDDALTYLNHNSETVFKNVIEHDDNSWLSKSGFPKPIFIEKKLQIEDFTLISNPNDSDKEIDFQNSVLIYEKLKDLPMYILCDIRFWLWLIFDKFYKETKEFMELTKTNTMRNNWSDCQGKRRSLMFNVLARKFFRVYLTVDENNVNKYELTRWILDKSKRLREYTWRNYSSNKNIVLAALKGSKRAVDEGISEKDKMYDYVAAELSFLGGSKCLDAMSEEYIESFVYNKMKNYKKD